MIIPIRCFSCGFPISEFYEEYKKQLKAGTNSKEVLNELGLKRYCCRRMFVTQSDLIEDIAVFKK